MESNKPIKVIKQGLVSVSVWKKDGMPTSYTFQRSYKQNDEWKHSNNLNLNDLYIVQKIINKITSDEIIEINN